MAAQERAKQAKPKAESSPQQQEQQEAPPPDFFGSMETTSNNNSTPSAPPPSFDFMNNNTATATSAAPPAFDEAALPPPPAQEEAAPPSFDTLEGTLKPPPAPSMNFDPMAPSAPAVLQPSAPTFEDLLGGSTNTNTYTNSSSDNNYGAPPPTFDEVETLPPPQQQQQSDHPQAFAEDFAGLEGLSEEEKQALLDEQRRIMEEIERNKSGNSASAAVAAAEAFDQRSNAAVARIAGGETRVRLPDANQQQQRTVKVGGDQEVALHGQEKTQKAIEDGTAILVECVNCNNWMQVTDNATLMFCPACQVVSPVDRENALRTKEEVLQLEADRKLAEELQKEEYSAAERAEQAERRRKKREQKAKEEAAKQGESWWDWLGLGGATTTDATTTTQTQPQYRGDLGQSRPPGAGAAGLSSVQTGEINYSNSYDREDRPLMTQGGARVAQAKPLFACVADSISTAANSLYTQNLSQDEEGNVHGVDSSSLLAMSNAGRGDNTRGGYD